MHIDGSFNRHAGGIGVELLSPEGNQIKCMVCLDFPTINNEAEYKALVTGLDLAKAAGATSVVLYCDSQVVTSQVNGDYKCRGARMKRHLDQVRRGRRVKGQSYPDPQRRKQTCRPPCQIRLS